MIKMEVEYSHWDSLIEVEIEFDARHPMVKQCIEQGLCTNTLPKIISQRMDYWSDYCETCWIHCKRKPRRELRWSMRGDECQCICMNC